MTELPGTLVIRGVTVIDGTGARPIPSATVTITGDRIDAIRTGTAPTPAGALTIDGAGKYLIPGLFDMHGHLCDASVSALAQLVANGVTGVRDLGGDLATIDAWRSEIAESRRVGPRIWRAGPFVDGPKDGVTSRLTVRSPEEARSAVHRLRADGVDVVKVHNALPREAFFALMEAARSVGLSVAAHLPEGVGSAEASNAGVASLEHVETMVESMLWQPGATASSIDEALDQLCGPAGTELFATFVANGTAYVPTLVAYQRGFALWSNQPDAVSIRMAVLRRLVEVVGRMHAAGVVLLAGSDYSDWGIVAGIDLHNELALLVEAGLSPMDALQSATMRPAEFLGVADDVGSVEEGKIADLIVLDANPLESISHTRKVRVVVLGGVPLEVTQLVSGALSAAVARHTRG